MFWNKTITLYNKSEDDQTGIKWYRHKLENCFFKSTRNVSEGGGVQRATTDTVIRIPKQNNFLAPFEWVGLSDRDKANYLTLQEGDLIILGDVHEDIDEYTTGQRSSDLIAKYSTLGSVFVDSVRNNTDLPGAHYFVGGK